MMNMGSYSTYWGNLYPGGYTCTMSYLATHDGSGLSIPQHCNSGTECIDPNTPVNNGHSHTPNLKLAAPIAYNAATETSGLGSGTSIVYGRFVKFKRSGPGSTGPFLYCRLVLLEYTPTTAGAPLCVAAIGYEVTEASAGPDARDVTGVRQLDPQSSKSYYYVTLGDISFSVTTTPPP
jgi:hypothetical protein